MVVINLNMSCCVFAGKNCQIVNAAGVDEAVREDEGLYIRSGIVCVLRNAEIPDGTKV